MLGKDFLACSKAYKSNTPFPWTLLEHDRNGRGQRCHQHIDEPVFPTFLEELWHEVLHPTFSTLHDFIALQTAISSALYSAFFSGTTTFTILELFHHSLILYVTLF